MDPKFYKDWKLKLDQQGLLCPACKSEFSAAQALAENLSIEDSDDEELKNVKLSEEQSF